MSRRAFVIAAIVLLAAGVAIRVNNALTFPPLQAYDGFSHFSYIWFMAEHWRVPLATTGWEFFQPPLYYWFMAAVWDGLAPVDPMMRLRVGTLVIALLGLSLAFVSVVAVRRTLPNDRLAQLMALGLMLFVPVHLYTAGFLGNENLTAVTSAWAIGGTLALLARPTTGRAVLLGLLLGVAMLTKFTGVVVVAGALGTLGLRAILRRDRRERDARLFVIAGAVMLVLSGWFYARNVMVYGTPFKMSRETFMLQRYENVQTRGQRGFLEYVLFDPLILRRPEWPRGVGLVGNERPFGYSAMRESVPTGVYANAWFEGYGGWVLPKVTQDEPTRRAGQLLLTLGVVPTVLVLIGLWQAVARLRREGWDDTIVLMLLTFGAMMAVLVQGTRAVPIHAAVKTTYLMPASVTFAYWLALGVAWLRARNRRALAVATVVSAVLAMASGFVFLQGRTVGAWWIEESQKGSLWRNVAGVVYYAGGDVERARELFTLAAADGHHLGWENLSVLALDEDRPLEALHYLRRAAELQPSQSLGVPADQALFNRLTHAEYLNTMAVIYHRLGWDAAALAAAQEAVASDPAMPEASYDLALLKLATVAAHASHDDPAWRTAYVAQSRVLLWNVLVGDPGFADARVLAEVAAMLAGDCPDGGGTPAGDAPSAHRLYPVDTGVGDLLASAVRRRRHITELPELLRPELRVARCADHAADERRARRDDGA